MEHGLRFPGPMELFDLAIVYMSLGAPIGVYRYFQIRGAGQVPKLFRATAVWLLWPPAAFILLTRIFRKKRFITQIAAPFDLDATLKRRQRELIRAVSRTMEPRKVFEVRSAVERYGGLTSATLPDSDRDPGANLFGAAGRRYSETSIVCLERRNASRLARHQKDAREDFLSLIQRHGPDNDEILALAEEIVRLLDDAEATLRIAEIRDDLAARRDLSGRALWNTEERSTLRSQLPLDLSPSTTMAALRKD